MIPDFIFEWIALNPKTATTVIVGFMSFCAAAIWTGFYLEGDNTDE